MFFPLHILRRHLVWIISAKRFYTVSDKFCLVDHSNACLEAVRAGIDASKTVRQSQILVSSFPQCCLLLACGCLMLEFFSWLPPDCWFGVGLPHRFNHVCQTSVKNLQHEHPSEACWVHYVIHFVSIHIHACLEWQFVTSSSVTIASCWAVLGILSRDWLHCSHPNP